jgi:hypothetical protein
LLAQSVRDQANVLAYIDSFMVLGFAVIGVLLLRLLLRDPPARRTRLGGPAVVPALVSSVVRQADCRNEYLFTKLGN